MNAGLARVLRALSCLAAFGGALNLAFADGWRMPVGAAGLAVVFAVVADRVQRPDPPPAAEPADTPEPQGARPTLDYETDPK